jgi:hypothetical protein
MERDKITRRTMKDGSIKEYKYKRIIKGTKKEVSNRQQLRYITSNLSQELCGKLLKFIEDERKMEEQSKHEEQ